MKIDTHVSTAIFFFKNMTENAVKAFQADHGYPRSGYVSQELIDLMVTAEKIYAAPADAEP